MLCVVISHIQRVSLLSTTKTSFSREGTPMLRVTLKDGRVVGGYFA
jgi:hypothetical protein